MPQALFVTQSHLFRLSKCMRTLTHPHRLKLVTPETAVNGLLFAAFALLILTTLAVYVASAGR